MMTSYTPNTSARCQSMLSFECVCVCVCVYVDILRTRISEKATVRNLSASRRMFHVRLDTVLGPAKLLVHDAKIRGCV